MNLENRKLNYIDILVVISCIAVVFLHINAYDLYGYEEFWFASNFIQISLQFAVPIFFMISGATLIDFSKRYDLKNYAVKRIRKTLIPFLFWSLISYFLCYIFNDLPKSGNNIFLNVINTKYNFSYWFFIPLFAIYLTIPILNKIPENNRIYIFLYIIIYGFFTYSTIPVIEKWFHIKINHDIFSPFAGGYIIYPLLGYVIHKTKLEKQHRLAIYLYGILAFILHYFGAMFLTGEAGITHKVLTGYIRFPTLLTALAIFTFARYTNWDFLYKKKKLINLIYFIRDNSLGIYLLHIFFLSYLFYDIRAMFVSPIIFKLLVPVITIAISATISQLIRKTTILKWSLGE